MDLHRRCAAACLILLSLAGGLGSLIPASCPCQSDRAACCCAAGGDHHAGQGGATVEAASAAGAAGAAGGHCAGSGMQSHCVLSKDPGSVQHPPHAVVAPATQWAELPALAGSAPEPRAELVLAAAPSFDRLREPPRTPPPRPSLVA